MSTDGPTQPSAGLAQTSPAPSRLRTWHLIVALLLVVASIVFAVALAIKVGVDALANNLDVSIEDVDLTFLDRKKRRVDMSASTLLNPGATAKKIRGGYLKIALHLEIVNRNPVDLVADRVDYRVTINKVKAGVGHMPARGGEPLILRRAVVEERTVSVRIKTKSVLKGSGASILKGARLVIRVVGTAKMTVLGLTVDHDFSVKKIHKYGALGRSRLPIPFP